MHAGTAMAAAATLAAPTVADQFDELWRQIPETTGEFERRLREYAWGELLVERLQQPPALGPEQGRAAAVAFASGFSAIGSIVVIAFIGLYVAAAPETYEAGLRLLLAPSLRPRAAAALNEAGRVLKWWLAGQLLSMLIVGVLTGLGLWLVGAPLALVLGLIAGLLSFIPYLGPVLAAVPGLLVALPEGLTMVGWVAAVYVVVQVLESYLVTPLIQLEQVRLPPALTLAAQILFGIWFGLLGLLLATPFAAVAMTLARRLYVEDYLEGEAGAAGGDRRAAAE